MRANRKVGTKPEDALRRELHRGGVRYRIGAVIVASGIRVVPDVVLRRARVAVFVDGCWWHCCSIHANTPRANTDYWLPKLARNVERDREVDLALASAGWRVIRIWEHEIRADVAGSVQRIMTVSEAARR